MINHFLHLCKLFVGITIVVMSIACSSRVIPITIYTSLQDHQVDEFVEHILMTLDSSACPIISREKMQFNIIALKSSDDLINQYKDQSISIDSFQLILQKTDLLIGLGSNDLLNISNNLGDRQRHFIDEESLTQSFLELICDQDLHSKIAIAYHISLREDSEESESADYVKDQIPIFNEEKLYELAFDTFGKFAEAQNLLANEKNNNITDELITNTLRLFHSERSIVQIQNGSSAKIIELTIPEYLSRMHRLNQYDQIHYQWNDDIKILTPWHDNGVELSNQKSTLMGKQRFTGYRKNMILYSDMVHKSIELHADLTETIDIMGNSVLEWQVLIGDIRILTEDKGSLNPQTT